MSRFRVSMDIGGTFTDVVAYDEEAGTYMAGKVVYHADCPDPRRPDGARERRAVACAMWFCRPRHDAGAERVLAATGRARALARDCRRGQCPPHRARQPHAPVRHPLPQAGAARASLGHRRDPGTPELRPVRDGFAGRGPPKGDRRAALFAATSGTTHRSSQRSSQRSSFDVTAGTSH
jgi:hypothetical protein